jgi:hypothetical protein
MRTGCVVTRSIFILLLPLIGIVSTAADAPSLAALGLLQPGRWALSSRDPSFTARSICIGDPQVLLQIRQPVASCNRFVIANTPQSATINYTCPGQGSGRTTVRVETPRLAQVETQGIVGGALFDLSIEARRTGDCTALSSR